MLEGYCLTTAGRTPLDEWSARRRDLYLTTHNTTKIQTCLNTVPNIQHFVLCVNSGFSREVDENCALLGCYTASSGDLLPTFRDNLSVPFSGVMSGIGITTTSRVTAQKSTLVSILNHCIQSDNKQKKNKNPYKRQQNKIKMINLSSFFETTTGTSGFCPKLSRNGRTVSVDCNRNWTEPVPMLHGTKRTDRLTARVVTSVLRKGN